MFFLVPILIMFVYSLMPRGIYGGVEPGFTLEHYRRFFDPLYLDILQRTFVWSVACTVICLLLGYPVAYAIARGGKWKNLLLFLVVLPFWTSFLVRTFAMIFLLRDTGLINNWLLKLGLIEEPITMLYTPFAVMAGLVYGFLPFMILPIYASLEKLDLSLLEAAEVLGARPAERFRRVTLPLSMPGVVAGCLLVFIPALGSFLTSDLLGGAKQMMIGNLVQNQFSAARNWPFGSAASFIVMALVLVAVMLYLRVKDKTPGEARLRWASRCPGGSSASAWRCTPSSTCRSWCWWSSRSTTPSSRWTGPASRSTGTTGCCERPDILRGLKASLIVGGASTVISAVLGTLIALALARHRFRGRTALEGFLYVPIVTPEIVVGISLLILFALVEDSRSASRPSSSRTWRSASPSW